jgi:hypothetical protein
MRIHLIRAVPFALGLLLLTGPTAHAALVANWTFDSTGADQWNDSVGGNHGTAVGTPTQTAGVIGAYAYEGNGAANYLDVDNGAAFQTDTYTISAWLRPDTIAGWRTAVGSWNGSAHWVHFGLDANTGKFSNYVNIGGDKPVRSTTVVPSGNTAWYHVVTVADPLNDVLQIYVNGVKQGETTISGWTTTEKPGTNPVLLGAAYATSSGNFWDGGIDDVAIWNRALTASEIATLNTKGLQGIGAAQALARSPASGLVSYYSFEHNSADMARHYKNTSSTVDDNLAPAGTVGGVSYVQGKVGMAADLNGGYFTTANSADVRLPNTFTIEAWVNPDSITGGAFQRLVLDWGGTSSRAYHFGIYGDDVNLYLSADGSGQYEVASGGTMVRGVWQHIAAVSDGTNVIVYLNGEEVDRGLLDVAGLYQSTTEPLGVGDSGSVPGSRFYGLLDELAMWNVALTPEQISEHFAAGAAGYGLSVPEPGTFAMLLGGGLLAVVARRRRRFWI